MIRKIILENFMAHGRTELPLGPGLTVLTGQNNVGKSAVVEALRCLSANTPAQGFIRHGAKEARVELELDEGSVLWRRKSGSASYEIRGPGSCEPGEEYHKLGRSSVPEDVQKLLRLDKVEVEGLAGGLDVHLGNQREPIFLLDLPGSAQAGFFAASSEAAHLLNMQNLLKTKVREAREREKASNARLDRLSRTLDRLSGLPGLALAMEAASGLLDSLESLERYVPLLEGRIGAMGRLSGKRLTFLAQAQFLGRLSSPPALNDTQGLMESIRDLRAGRREQGIARRRRESLSTLIQPPLLEETAALQGAAAGLRKRMSSLEAGRAKFEVLSSLRPAAETSPTGELADVAARLRETGKRRARALLRLEILAGAAKAPDLPPTADLERSAARIREALRRRLELAAELELRKTEVQDMEERVRQRLEALGACPLCGADLESGRFLEGVRHGGTS